MDNPEFEVRIDFDPGIHSQSSLLRVAYAMADRIALDLRGCEGRFVLIGTAAAGRDVTALADEIRISAVDFALREEIEAKTAGMRDAIWRTAFAETVGGGR
ncbi:hypothetical protein [Tardiphaga sp. OK245]|uniref:hypothetical protein n=1 Tax=Tardiphaga sp. OK245 TaxID=1855306 RepID=UPI0008A7EA22|nr:hypothetical protein [Tardiphaga sp. OK245]SEH87444.1 His-Xaa-Ser system protein HxsD [Tardiphaga sp. OK245]